jgi:hypothetical protein
MREDSDPLAWVNHLTLEQARQHLEDRGLKISGILPVLRARLLRYEEAQWRGIVRPSSPNPLDEAAGPADAMLPPRGAIPKASTPKRINPEAEYELPRTSQGTFGEGKGSYFHDPRPESFPSAFEHPKPRASTAEAYNLMRKWNLHFSGKRGNNAEVFLLRIKEARAIVPIADADLFKCLPLFLSDTALYWVRLESANWRGWDDFERAWRARFGDPDYQYALREEVWRRTQGEHESAADYLTCLRVLLSWISPPWTLAEQLNVAHRNMLPRLHGHPPPQISRLPYVGGVGYPSQTRPSRRARVPTPVTSRTVALSRPGILRPQRKTKKPRYRSDNRNP